MAYIHFCPWSSILKYLPLHVLVSLIIAGSIRSRAIANVNHPYSSAHLLMTVVNSIDLLVILLIDPANSSQVFCLEHRSYGRHQCPKANKHDVTVVICPLCAKGVRLIHSEDPNITWESHVNIECDPSNYENTTKKRKCPVPGCREILTFSNSIKCRDCTLDHCLKHRFGPDHQCPGPKKPESSFQFMGFLNRSQKEDPKRAPVTSSSKWASSFLKAASSVRATAEAGITRLSNEFNQALSKDGAVQSSNCSTSHHGSASGQVEVCPLCNLRFTNVGALVDHVEKVHERNGVMKATLDVCPTCNKGFRDPVTLVEHVEREHGSVSKS